MSDASLGAWESIGSRAHREGIAAEGKEEEVRQLEKVAGPPTTQASVARPSEAPREIDSQAPKPLPMWRSLEEFEGSERFDEMVHREFPDNATEWTDPISRRRFLEIMGASAALAGISGCTRQPAEPIVPYVRPPEEIVPGKPLYFATALTLGGFATGVLVESHMGRPTKVEGNPDHPASLGSTGVFEQAAVLELYDPDRSQTLTHRGEIRAWGAFVSAMRVAYLGMRSKKGAGLRILTETVTSPALGAQLRGILAELPEAKWHQWEPLNRDAAVAGAKLAFGEPVATRFDFSKADVVLSLDADFLGSGPGAVRYARDFARRRRVRAGEGAGAGAPCRLYAVESTPSIAGSKADHRLPMRPGEIEAFSKAVAAAARGEPGTGTGTNAAFMEAVTKDLLAAKGRGIVMAGPYQPAHVHALAHAANVALGNVGTTAIHTEPVEQAPVDQAESLRELCRDLEAGKVELLVILGGNPVYSAPADLKFAEALAKAATRVHLGLYRDETGVACQWHVPAAHALEAWGDARAHDGTVSIVQPLIAPLYGGKSAHEVLAVFSEAAEKSGHDLVKGFWQARHGEGAFGAPGAGFEAAWRRALHDGVVAGTALAPKAVSLRAFEGPKDAGAGQAKDFEVLFRADPRVWDGRFANLGWLQELPKPLTHLTWDNTALMSRATAERLHVENGDLVALSHEGRQVRAPAWIRPGQADGVVTLHLGYGRTRAGRVGNGAGFDANKLRAAASPWQAAGVSIEAAGGRAELACTQLHHDMVGRNLARAGSLDQWKADPAFAQKLVHEPARSLTLYPEHKYEGYAWGMAIDLGACIGCSACTIACQAENNIPVVGKTEVIRQREMHWIRVDSYFEGEPENPKIHHQPVPCMHCENAPCEVVCPVAATAHSSEGLNDMIYNRCVGTRYCSNNCPYKVRRFNFFLYQDFDTPSLTLLRNPDVSVRSRGVMEKCTYCVQRINSARIQSKLEDRTIRDGEILPACAQACPAEAIVFGDVNDPKSAVSRLKADPLNYSILADLNTRPRTTYLAAVRHSNPALEPVPAAAPPKKEAGGHG